MSDQKKTVFGYAAPTRPSGQLPAGADAGTAAGEGATGAEAQDYGDTVLDHSAPRSYGDTVLDHGPPPGFGDAPPNYAAQSYGDAAQSPGGAQDHGAPQNGGAPQNFDGSQQHAGGAPQNYGDAPHDQGGPQNYGGAPQNYGGAPQGYGGAPQNYGGAPQNYGGAPQGYGGAPQNYGGAPQGYGGAPQGYGAPQNFQQPPPPRVSPVTTGLYAGMVLLGLVALVMLGVGATDPALTEMLPFSAIPLVVAAIFNLTLVYKAWAAIQDGYQRTTPGAAIGFLFIPLFSVYWLFIAYGAWGRNFNAFAQRHGIAFRVSEGLFTTHCVLLLFGGPLSLISALMVTVAMCRGINAVAYLQVGGMPVARIANG